MTLFRPDAKPLAALFRLFLMLTGVLLFNADRAMADGYMDLSGGDSGCTDPIYTGFGANSMGGSCLAFQNPMNPGGGGVPFDSLQFTTSLPLYDPITGTSRTSDTFHCSGGNLFTGCGFSIDGGVNVDPSGTTYRTGSELTILFFGGSGIPSGGNFFLNLNDPCPISSTDACSPNRNGAGDWLVGPGMGSSFTGVANAPEPNMQILVLMAGFGLVLARKKLAGIRRQGSQEPERDIS
jgi:hypothetical protein